MRYISTTQLQRDPKSVFGKAHFQLILSNNKPQGMLISQEVAEYLEKSGLMHQIREELWELHDETTRKTIEEARSHSSETMNFTDFAEEYAL
ncbi:hypothetical protein COB57_06195 [Candidatus Peregrinibacteria bacterium]|nr:MAG: hypothetical protein COB57_06195 [Candidatus Peregrinibacteria bacterium]